MSRSKFDIQLTCNPNDANNIIQAFLGANGFTLKNDKGEQYYAAGNVMIDGGRYFKYSFNNNILTIYAWINRGLGEGKIERLNMAAVPYRNSLNSLFQEIAKINGGNAVNMESESQSQAENTTINMNNMQNPNYQPNNPNINNMQNPNYQPNNPNMNNMQNPNYQPNNPNMNNMQNPNYQPNNQNDFAQRFQDETTKKQETMCEIGFWLSIFGLLLSFLGASLGIIIYIVNFFFASQGLKTRKSGKAITTIVLSIISLVIVVMRILFSI